MFILQKSIYYNTNLDLLSDDGKEVKVKKNVLLDKFESLYF